MEGGWVVGREGGWAGGWEGGSEGGRVGGREVGSEGWRTVGREGLNECLEDSVELALRSPPLQASVFLANGSEFHGSFKAGRMNGHGKYAYGDGQALYIYIIYI